MLVVRVVGDGGDRGEEVLGGVCGATVGALELAELGECGLVHADEVFELDEVVVDPGVLGEVGVLEQVDGRRPLVVVDEQRVHHELDEVGREALELDLQRREVLDARKLGVEEVLVVEEADLEVVGQVAERVHDQVQLVQVGLARKQRLRRQHLVGEHAYGPDVHRSNETIRK